jgi:hypothetical protein
MGFELRWSSGSMEPVSMCANSTGAIVAWELTGLKDVFELRSRDDCETVGNDRVGGVVAVVVNEDFVGGRHVGGMYFAVLILMCCVVRLVAIILRSMLA